MHFWWSKVFKRWVEKFVKQDVPAWETSRVWPVIIIHGLCTLPGLAGVLSSLGAGTGSRERNSLVPRPQPNSTGGGPVPINLVPRLYEKQPGNEARNEATLICTCTTDQLVCQLTWLLQSRVTIHVKDFPLPVPGNTNSSIPSPNKKCI